MGLIRKPFSEAGAVKYPRWRFPDRRNRVLKTRAVLRMPKHEASGSACSGALWTRMT